MIKRQSISDDSIVRCLNTHYNIKANTLTFLSLGADVNASIYKVQACDQISYFVKLKRGHHQDVSVVIIDLLQKAGIQQVIPPIKTIHGKLSQHLKDCTVIVYPFVEGQNGFSRNLTDHQWISLGQTLKQIHELEVPPSIQKTIRRETYSPKWREAVRSLPLLIEDPVALKLLKFMKENAAAICRLVDRAEQLAQKIQNFSLPFVLCHSDLHAGNVLMDEKDAMYMVDWDDPVMAPKERDLMFIGGGVANVWNEPDEEKLFYEGYGKTEINRAILAYYRHERIVEDIAIYGKELLLRTSENMDREEMYLQFVAMFEPNGVVEIAFKTDEELLEFN